MRLPRTSGTWLVLLQNDVILIFDQTVKKPFDQEIGAPGMGDNLVVKVHYGLGSRNR